MPRRRKANRAGQAVMQVPHSERADRKARVTAFDESNANRATQAMRKLRSAAQAHRATQLNRALIKK
jgi:hypothetical protein